MLSPEQVQILHCINAPDSAELAAAKAHLTQCRRIESKLVAIPREELEPNELREVLADIESAQRQTEDARVEVNRLRLPDLHQRATMYGALQLMAQREISSIHRQLKAVAPHVLRELSAPESLEVSA